MTRGVSVVLMAASLLALASAASAQELVEGAPGGVLRALDRVSGEVADLDLPNGADAHFGRLIINLQECRFPAEDPAGDAFAYVTISPDDGGAPFFAGWMIASSPGLSALDHPRYDVWVLRCMSS